MTGQPQAPQPLSAAEINGRFGELTAQRDAALARCQMLAGQNAELIDLLKEAKAEMERLTALLQQGHQSDATTGPRADDPPAQPGTGTTAH
ncbi:hypothetical protein MMB17_18595 [Methylobacterium organophilum]|uniref:hypothetical protein n=1 Tax=Methylobacterium organophilum TaxID=410 RepID=UPI001F146D95|nr:hypothetical protein [Methylobacterium organophilum]UMY16672.1 hypothetical protein MMB17_18595 [Methylobacterium organophilum]